MKKLIALILALVLALGLVACGGTTGQTDGEPTADGETAAPEEKGLYLHPGDYHGELPLVPEGEEKTITIGIITNGNITSYDDNLFTQWVEEQTGVNIEFTQFAGSKADVGTQISLMIASGETLPDILLNVGGASSGITKAVAKEYCRDGYFVDLRDYIDTDAYYIRQAAEMYFPGEKYDEFLKLLIGGATDPVTGAIYAVPTNFASEADELHGHVWINQTWLDNLGLEQPKTIEELYDVMVAFRDQDPNGNGQKDEIPMTGRASSSQYNILQYIINAYIYCYDKYKFIVNDGVVSAPYDTDEYREALKFISKCVKENLITPLTWTQSQPELMTLVNPTAGMPETVGIFQGPGERFDADGQSIYDYEPLRLLEDATGKGGHGPVTCTLTYAATYITEDCDDPELAFRLMDFIASPESYLRQRWGIPGEDWDYYEDPTGKSGMLGGPARIIVHNPTALEGIHNKSWGEYIGITSEQYWQQLVDINDGTYTGTLYKKLQGQVKNYHDMGMNQEVIYLMLNLTDEEDQAWSEANPDINEYIMTARSNFCNGIWDPENDGDWNNYLSDLKGLGYYDPWIAVAQASYDRDHG